MEQQDSHFVKQARRVLLFQVKLVFDAVRDVFFSPLSIIAFLIDSAFGEKNQTKYFDFLLSLGRRSDHMINLFEEYNDKQNNVDSVFQKVEEIIRNQYQEGEISETAKKHFQQSLAAVKKFGKTKNKNDKKDT